VHEAVGAGPVLLEVECQNIAAEGLEAAGDDYWAVRQGYIAEKRKLVVEVVVERTDFHPRWKQQPMCLAMMRDQLFLRRRRLAAEHILVAVRAGEGHELEVGRLARLVSPKQTPPCRYSRRTWIEMINI